MTAAYALHRGHQRLKPLIDFALKAGWKIVRTPSGNLKFTKQGLPQIYTGSTTGDHHAGYNTLARLRPTTNPRATTKENDVDG
jgi:hypothetical protein